MCPLSWCTTALVVRNCEQEECAHVQSDRTMPSSRSQRPAGLLCSSCVGKSAAGREFVWSRSSGSASWGSALNRLPDEDILRHTSELSSAHKIRGPSKDSRPDRLSIWGRSCPSRAVGNKSLCTRLSDRARCPRLRWITAAGVDQTDMTCCGSRSVGR